MKREEYPPHVQRKIEEAESRAIAIAESPAARRFVEIIQPTIPLMTIRSTAKGRMPTPTYRSQLEADRAEFLQARQLAGEIAWWAHEPWRFALGGGAWYKPDFGIMYPDGTLEAEECKGFWREAARLRIKVAASRHVIRFVAITRFEGRWTEELFS